MFQIILAEDKMETQFGTLYRGDVLETIDCDSEMKVRKYVAYNYKLEGILVDYVEVES